MGARLAVGSPARRLRRAPRQLAALRLAGRAAASRSASQFCAARRVGCGRSGATLGGDNGDHVPELRHAYVWGAGGLYNNGPLQVGIGTSRNNKVRGPGPDRLRRSRVTGAWNFGVVRVGGVYERLKYDIADGRRPEAQLLGRQRHGADRSGPAVRVLRQGERRQGLARPTARASAASSKGRGHGLAPVGSQLHVSAVEAHADLRRLRARSTTTASAAYTSTSTPYTIASRRHDRRDGSAIGKPGGLVLGMIAPVLSRHGSAAGAFGRRCQVIRRAPHGARFFACGDPALGGTIASMLDTLILGFDRALRTLSGTVVAGAARRPARACPKPS